MDINCSHLGFFKAEANKYYVLCMEDFYGTDYCPLETGQTPLSKPHLWPQTNVRPQEDFSPIKNTLPFPGCNIYFPCPSKFISAKALSRPGLSQRGRCEHWAVGKVKIFLDGSSLWNVLRNITTPWCFQGQNYPFYALFLMCCLGWICDRFLFVGTIGDGMSRGLLLRAASIPLPLSPTAWAMNQDIFYYFYSSIQWCKAYLSP